MTPDEREQLRFYRDEVKHEFNLLAMRTTTLVACQSFLIVPFAIFNTAPSFRAVAIPAGMVALLGVYTAWLSRAPIHAAHRILGEWLVKQRQLLDAQASDDYKSARDKIPGAAADSIHDSDHEGSLAFSKYAPLAFITFWIVAGFWIAIRAAIGF